MFLPFAEKKFGKPIPFYYVYFSIFQYVIFLRCFQYFFLNSDQKIIQLKCILEKDVKSSEIYATQVGPVGGLLYRKCSVFGSNNQKAARLVATPIKLLPRWPLLTHSMEQSPP